MKMTICQDTVGLLGFFSVKTGQWPASQLRQQIRMAGASNLEHQLGADLGSFRHSILYASLQLSSIGVRGTSALLT